MNLQRTIAIIMLTTMPILVQGQMFNAGIRAGINSNRFITDGDDFKDGDTKIGLVGGLFVRLKTGMFWFQPEAIFSHKSGMFSYSSVNDGVDTFINASLTNIDIPIVAGLQFGKWLRIGTGPVVSYPFKEKVTFHSTTNTSSITIEKSFFKNAAFSWQFSAALEVSRLVFDVRYEIGIDKMNYGIDLPNQAASVDPVIRSLTWQFSVGYKFVKSS
jgi:hypothetical protein